MYGKPLMGSIPALKIIATYICSDLLQCFFACVLISVERLNELLLLEGWTINAVAQKMGWLVCLGTAKGRICF